MVAPWVTLAPGPSAQLLQPPVGSPALRPPRALLRSVKASALARHLSALHSALLPALAHMSSRLGRRGQLALTAVSATLASLGCLLCLLLPSSHGLLGLGLLAVSTGLVVSLAACTLHRLKQQEGGSRLKARV
jgi:MFS family permease